MLSILCSSLITLGIKGNPILFLPEFIRFQLPNMSCSCALSEIFFPFRSFHTVIPAYFCFPQHKRSDTFVVPAGETDFSEFFCSASAAVCQCPVQRGEQQCRTGLCSRFSPGILNTQSKSCNKAELALFPSVLLCVIH